MALLEQYLTTEMLENYLGDPFDSNSLFSFERAVEIDECEEYPHEFVDLVNAWNFHHYYIPKEYGGKFQSFEELLSLERTFLRRELSLVSAHGVTYLGALPVWIGGTIRQKMQLAERIKNRDLISFG
ncbi:MAG: hypothetical protein SFY66_15550 [Oculatellaceae cyanobacterium bins.114]|nr:hypothetical protein [Oculatellaceae cyanobacterium bins.114]